MPGPIHRGLPAFLIPPHPPADCQPIRREPAGAAQGPRGWANSRGTQAPPAKGAGARRPRLGRGSSGAQAWMWRVTLNCSREPNSLPPARPRSPGLSASPPRPTPATPPRPDQPSPPDASSSFLPQDTGPCRRANCHAQLAKEPRSTPQETRHRCPSRDAQRTDAAARLGPPRPLVSSPPLRSRAPVPPFECCAKWPPRHSSLLPCASACGADVLAPDHAAAEGASTCPPTPQPSAAASAVTSPSPIGWIRPRPPLRGSQSPRSVSGERTGRPSRPLRPGKCSP